VTTEPAPASANPYAPSDAVAHEAARHVRSGPSRLLAVVATLLAYPIVGAGLYVLGRRRFYIWIAAGLAIIALMIVSAHAGLPKLYIAMNIALYVAVLAALADSGFATRGDPAPRLRRALVVAVLLFAAARGGSMAMKRWLVANFQTPSGSMMPTLEVGELFVVRKTKRIGHGDVIVFRYPVDETVEYVKRVVAVGGQSVELVSGVVKVDGVPLEQSRMAGHDCPVSEETMTGCALFRENGGTRSYTIMREARSPADFPLTRVPPGHVFVLGDNRDNSMDSRVWGTLPIELVEGQAMFTLIARDHDGNIRGDRIGRIIE
jgi:signal peptidase I